MMMMMLLKSMNSDSDLAVMKNLEQIESTIAEFLEKIVQSSPLLSKEKVSDKSYSVADTFRDVTTMATFDV